MASGGWPERREGAPPPAEPGPASWPTAAAPAGPQQPVDVDEGRSWFDLKFLIVIMIGIVSVTGAVMTWQASQLGEYATDHDRQALAETVRQQQDRAAVASQVDQEVQVFARYKEQLTNAIELERQAEQLRGRGLEDEALNAEDRASEQRQLADQLLLLTLGNARDKYVAGDEATGDVTFDVELRSADLQTDRDSQFPADPGQTATEGDDLRARSQRLVGWTIPLVLAVVLFTVAQLVASRRLRPFAAGLGLAVYLGATVAAFVGN
jgi:hypothetical protein